MTTICWWWRRSTCCAWCTAMLPVITTKVCLPDRAFSCCVRWCSFRFVADLPENLLERKIALCETCLTIYDAVDPGEANQRANVLFELNCARIIQVRGKLNRNLISREDATVGTCFWRFSWSKKNFKSHLFRLPSMKVWRRLNGATTFLLRRPRTNESWMEDSRGF